MKQLMFSTALVAVTALPTMAQDANTMFHAEANAMEIHASDFIGMRVYRAEDAQEDAYEGMQDNWDDIGEINDVIMNRDGDVQAVLVDIGGFLGIGENQVAVKMDAIRFVSDSSTMDDEADYFLVMNAPRSALEEAPGYGSMDNSTDDANMSDADVAPVADQSEVTPDTTRAPIVREGYMAMEETDLTAETLTGARVYDTNDEDIGEVSELLLTDDGKVKSAVVDVGGFLGIGEKPVALEMSKIDILRSDDGSDVRVYVPMTKEELEGMPNYDG
ncbi:PRC-barrel domain-containing protein [Aliiroseovarius sediminis]|uniref:PRC-barrel domain-containing protein n=1 Tax=Aliiroseovarius sediminis TaxID=2925839 RepID=UPI001F55B891|nr:PRC-barrel domain-containing protein [Aliiroseovarius sediminis]MCI2393727.1 PRC-barrel domain-containing protein [Aliiroseovarius sediminis]